MTSHPMADDETTLHRRKTRIIAPFVIATSVALSLASQAFAAPTCLDKNGDTIRCGAEGAMPVGWSPPELRQKPASDEQGWTNLEKAFCIVGVLLVGIALLPEFDGADDASWDKQEGENKKR